MLCPDEETSLLSLLRDAASLFLPVELALSVVVFETERGRERERQRERQREGQRERQRERVGQEPTPCLCLWTITHVMVEIGRAHV